MLTAPTRIAAPPRLKSRASWNPAVPPPPVAGAVVGNGLPDGLAVAGRAADGLGVADCAADGLGVAGCAADGLGVADRLAEALAFALGLVVSVPLGRDVGVADPVSPGENVAGVAGGEEPEQAETDAEASMVKVAQPATVNLPLSPVPMMVVRIFMGRPPHASGRWRIRADGHKSKAHGRRRHAMAYSSLEY
jgi:hypothetical protein